MLAPDLTNRLTAPFWLAAANNSLTLPRCGACHRYIWYPRAHCPACNGTPAWQAISGNATLLTWSVVRKPVAPLFAVPYITALVCPLEAPYVRLVTQLVDCDSASLRCDMPVEVAFRTLNTLTGESFVAPVFTPPQQH